MHLSCGREDDGWPKLIFEMTNLDNFHDAERQAGSEVFKIDLVDFWLLLR